MIDDSELIEDEKKYFRELRKKYHNYYYKKIRKEIYDYCDMNQPTKPKEKVLILFPAFVDYAGGFRNGHISKRDLVFLVSKVLDNLIDKNVLEISREKEKDNGYAFYKILRHENLVEHNSLIEKKMKLLSGDDITKS